MIGPLAHLQPASVLILTDERMVLFNLSNMLIPCESARAVPMNKLPTEQTESSKRPF